VLGAVLCAWRAPVRMHTARTLDLILGRFLCRLTTSPKLLKKGEVKETSVLLVHRAKLGSGKSATFARLHRGDMMASGGAGDVLEEALELKDNGRPGGKGWVKLTATPSLTYRRGASQSKTPDSDGADPPPETSTWEEADEVQAGLKAKRDALEAERDAKAAESRGQRSKDVDSRCAVLLASPMYATN
jgi:hypothetical protein